MSEFVKERSTVALKENAALTMSQAEIDTYFTEVIVPNYEHDRAGGDTRDYGKLVTEVVVPDYGLTREHADSGEQHEPKEKLSLRKRIGKKIGAAALEAYLYISGHRREHDVRLSSKRKVGAAALALTGLAAVSAYAAHKSGIGFDTVVDTFNNAPLHDADVATQAQVYNLAPEHTTNLLVGGRGDGSSGGLNSIVNGAPGFDAAHTVRVEYPAEIAPMPGDTHTLNESSEIAAQQVYDHLKQNGNDKTHLVMYSQGTQGGMEGLVRYVEENGGTLPPNIEVTVMASPNTPGSGVFHDDLVKQFTPLFENMGIDMRDADLPDGTKGVTFIANQNDLFANSGEGRNILRKAANAADFIGGGDGHAMTGFDDPSRHIVNEIDGNTYITIKPEGTQNPILRLAEMHGAYVSPEADKAFEAWMPAGEIGKVAPAVDVDYAIDTSADAIRRVLDDNHVAYDPAHFEIVKNLPIGQEIQKGVNDLLNLNVTPSAPEVPTTSAAPVEVASAPAPAPALEFVQPAPVYEQPVQTYVEPVYQASEPAYVAPQPVYEAPVSAYVAPAEQVTEAVNNFSTAAQDVANTWAPGNQQIQNDIQNVTDQVNGFMNQFGLTQ
jgi:hypothetical protein